MSLTRINIRHPLIYRRGRWQQNFTKDSITASWCSARLEFIFRGDCIYLQPGIGTRRVDRWNGGVPTILWTIRDITPAADDTPLKNDNAEIPVSPINSANTFSRTEMGIIDLDSVSFDTTPFEIYLSGQDASRTYRVQIILIDWASALELDAIFVRGELLPPHAPDNKDNVPFHRILFIGDSITCGFVPYGSHSSDRLTKSRGCWDAYPMIAGRILEEKWKAQVEIDVVAYPGVCLVSREDEDDHIAGMAEKFFHASPWDTSSWEFDENEAPSIVVIALGANDDAMDVNEGSFGRALEQFVLRSTHALGSSLRHVILVCPFQDYLEPPSTLKHHLEAVVIKLKAVLKNVTLHELDLGGIIDQGHTYDGLHPTLEGHRLMGCRMADVLSSCNNHLPKLNMLIRPWASVLGPHMGRPSREDQHSIMI